MEWKESIKKRLIIVSLEINIQRSNSPNDRLSGLTENRITLEPIDKRHRILKTLETLKNNGWPKTYQVNTNENWEVVAILISN